MDQILERGVMREIGQNHRARLMDGSCIIPLVGSYFCRL
jgi:hypothetical protein